MNLKPATKKLKIGPHAQGKSSVVESVKSRKELGMWIIEDPELD